MDPKLGKVAECIHRHREDAHELWNTLDRSGKGALGRLSMLLLVRETMPDVTKAELRRLLMRITYEADVDLEGAIYFQELQQVCDTCVTHTVATSRGRRPGGHHLLPGAAAGV